MMLRMFGRTPRAYALGYTHGGPLGLNKLILFFIGAMRRFYALGYTHDGPLDLLDQNILKDFKENISIYLDYRG